MNSPLATSLGIQTRGVDRLTWLAGMIVLGLETSRIKIERGYSGEGCWQGYRGEERQPWPEVCKAEVGFTETTGRNLEKCVPPVRRRLAEHPDGQQILTWMDGKPSDLSSDERAALVDGIRRLALREGDTQAKLIRELHAPAVPMLPATANCEAMPALDAEDINEVELFSVAAGVNPTTARMVGILHALKLRKEREHLKKRREEANQQREALPMNAAALARLALRALERERAGRLGLPTEPIDAEETGGSES